MEDSFSPRTVAIVSLSSLVGGFVAVFGGWMLLHRAPPRPPESAVAPSAPPAARALPDAATSESNDDDDAGATAAPATAGGDGGAVSIGAVAVSRCWAAGSPAVTPGAACDHLTGLEQHLASRAAQIAGCSSSHGRLSLVMDFRVSTNFARAWGGPSSTIPNAGVVAACVRRVTAPLPLTTMPHNFDRYIVNVAFEW
ncbi:MAG: hypothetical protein R3A48_06485 [Polyangiales bacterium]